MRPIPVCSVKNVNIVEYGLMPALVAADTMLCVKLACLCNLSSPRTLFTTTVYQNCRRSSFVLSSSAPVSLNKTTISPRNVVLKWEPPPPEDRNGLIVAYYLNITKLGSNVVQQFTTSNISITINNLKPYTYYSCIVSAATSAGISPYSTIFTFLTLQTGIGLMNIVVCVAMLSFSCNNSCSPKQFSNDY